MSDGEVECGRLREVERLSRPRAARRSWRLALVFRSSTGGLGRGSPSTMSRTPSSTRARIDCWNVPALGATAITAWYIGLMDGSGTPVLAATDMYAHIGNGNGWNANTGYSNGTRSNGPSDLRPSSLFPLHFSYLQHQRHRQHLRHVSWWAAARPQARLATTLAAERCGGKRRIKAARSP